MQDSIRIYDNNGKTLDRYTIIFMDRPYSSDPGSVVKEALAASEFPFESRGFGQHCGAMPGRHLGKRIKFEELPKDVQAFVLQNME